MLRPPARGKERRANEYFSSHARAALSTEAREVDFYFLFIHGLLLGCWQSHMISTLDNYAIVRYISAEWRKAQDYLVDFDFAWISSLSYCISAPFPFCSTHFL